MELNVLGQATYAYTGGKTFDPAKPTLVFVHGAANDHGVWGLQSRYFANHGYNVLAPDLPGHGRSQGTALNSVEALADWLPALLDAAGAREAGLIGHSMGSLVTLEAAARYPERIKTLALLGTAAPMAVSDALLDAAKNDPDQAYRMINQWSHGRPLGGNPAPGLWQPGCGLALLRHAHPGLIYQDLLNCRQYAHGLEAAAAVRCPTLLIIALNDLMTAPKAARALLPVLGDQTRVAEIPTCGHAMQGEQPDRVLDALRAFLL